MNYTDSGDPLQFGLAEYILLTDTLLTLVDTGLGQAKLVAAVLKVPPWGKPEDCLASNLTTSLAVNAAYF